MPKVLISDSMSNIAQKIFEKNNIQFDVLKLFLSMTEWLLDLLQK